MKNQYDICEVEKRDIQLATGQAIKDRKAVVRVDNNKVLGIVSNNYEIIQHENVIKTFDDIALLNRVSTNVCKDGAIMLAEYDIKDNSHVKTTDIAVGDAVNWRIRVFNSYNTMLGVGFELIANRLVCSNGLIVPKTISRLSFKHFNGFDSNRFNDLVGHRMNEIPKTTELWRTWLNVKPRDAQIKKYFDATNLGEKNRLDLYEQSLPARDSMGLWGVFNVITKFTSHDLRVRDEKNRAAAVRNREIALLGKFYNFQWSNN